MKYFIINVNPESKLYKHSLSVLDYLNVPVVRFPGYIKKKNESTPFFRDNIKLSNSTIGCGCSHRLLWTKLLNDPHENYYMIFEDDIESICSRDVFWRNINDALRLQNNPATKWDIYKLGKFNEHCNKIKHITGTLYKAYAPMGGHSYIISKHGAFKLLSRPKLKTSNDYELHEQCRKGYINIIENHPSLITQQLRYKEDYKHRNLPEIINQQNCCINSTLAPLYLLNVKLKHII